MPLAAPVTNATLPVNLAINLSLIIVQASLGELRRAIQPFA
jgi:hypothetical protein